MSGFFFLFKLSNVDIMKHIAVFCGARAGSQVVYRNEAAAVGRLIADRGMTLVYGGGSTGLMGAVSDAVLAHGGHVVGVIPQRLVDRELAHRGIQELVVVETMHERKAQMAMLADAFLVLPGGIGTLEELMEIYTWQYLGYHGKPIGLLNTGDFYGPFLRFLEHSVVQGFLDADTLGRLIVSDDPEELMERLAEDI